MRPNIHVRWFLVAVPFLLVLTLGCQQVPGTQGPNIEATVVAAVQTALPKPTPTPTPNIPLTVEAQVQEKLAAIPTPTPPPTLTPTPPPTLTPTPPPTLTPTPPPTPSLKTIVERARPAIVRIEAGLSTGSGFIAQVGFPTAQQATTALVLTNNHVIEGASSVEVIVNDRNRFDAEVWGVDPGNDIALLRICCGNFEALEWADKSEISEGNQAIAMGYPLGIPGKASVTTGIISAERFEFGQWVIQTDAAINPGNSGGPLISSSGEVLGINTRKEFYSSDGRPVDGLGFAISLRTVQSVLDNLKSGYMKPKPPPTLTPTPPPTATPTPVPRQSYGRPTWYISSVDTTVTGIKFFEGGWDEPAPESREYLRFFDGSTARFIRYQLQLEYPYRWFDSQYFDIELVLHRNGAYFASVTGTHKIWGGYSGGHITHGYGSSFPGYTFGPGSYVVALYSEGVLIANGEFDVY